ncbi:MAG TPA: zf-HC2 domain-containing protein [Bryobacteraceae bacterium]|nr:zf-HC2 domain-containing protein [Bryobacteraceae bacterium]
MVNSSHTHIEDELLELYAMKKLTESESEPVEEHLLVCHGCQDRLAETENFISTFRAAAEKLNHEPAREPLSERWFGRFFKMPKLMLVPALAGIAAIAVMVRISDVNQSPQIAELQSLRSGESTISVEAGRPVQLKLGAEGLSSQKNFTIHVVDSAGKLLWSRDAVWSSGWLTATIDKKLGAGGFWVRLFDAEQNKQVREYRLVVR